MYIKQTYTNTYKYVIQYRVDTGQLVAQLNSQSNTNTFETAVCIFQIQFIYPPRAPFPLQAIGLYCLRNLSLGYLSVKYIFFYLAVFDVNRSSNTICSNLKSLRYILISKTHCCCLLVKLCLTLLQSHGLQLTRLLCPRDFSGKNRGMGCHFLLQGTFLIQRLNPHLLHWQADSLLLNHLGTPLKNVHTFKMDNQQKPIVQSILFNAMWQHGQEGVLGRMDTCMCVAEFLHCSPETTAVLLTGYT